jgi:hypothetical protein
MILLETAPTTTIDASAPASFTCAQCPFARLIEDNRYCCAVSQTASDVKRGHWEATVSCYEALAKAEAEKVAEVEEAPIAQTATPAAPAPAVTRAPSKPAAASHATTTAAVTRAPIAPSAIGTNGDEPPNRGDNGRGRVQPIAKLMLSLVSVKRINSDIAASNFDPNEFEIAGELSLAISGFVIPRRAGARF